MHRHVKIHKQHEKYRTTNETDRYIQEQETHRFVTFPATMGIDDKKSNREVMISRVFSPKTRLDASIGHFTRAIGSPGHVVEISLIETTPDRDCLCSSHNSQLSLK
jgi:hypothetical protein